MKTMATAAATVLLMILFARGVPPDAGSITYYNRNSTPVPEGRYDRIVSEWYDCLNGTDSPDAFHRCLEEKAAGPRYGEPLVSDVPGLEAGAPDEPEEGEVIWLVPPEDPGRAIPPAGSGPTPPRDRPRPPAGSEPPPSVIERDIQVPGGGKLKVKEYKYQ